MKYRKTLLQVSALAIFGAFVAPRSALACDPDKIAIITMAPVAVNVPIGAQANVGGLVVCTTNADDFPNGQLQGKYDIRLVDEDGVADDVMGTTTDLINRVRGQGAQFNRRIRLNYTLKCPAANPRIEGDENSGEGQPNGGDPADLALEIDNGDDQRGENYYPGNLFGNPAAENTVPAKCVPGLADEDTQTSSLVIEKNQQQAVAYALMNSGAVLSESPQLPSAIAVGDYSEKDIHDYRQLLGKSLQDSAGQLGSLSFSTRRLGTDFGKGAFEGSMNLLMAGAAIQIQGLDLASSDLRAAARTLSNLASSTMRSILSEAAAVEAELRLASDAFSGAAQQLDTLAELPLFSGMPVTDAYAGYLGEVTRAGEALYRAGLAVSRSNRRTKVFHLPLGSHNDALEVASGDRLIVYLENGSSVSCRAESVGTIGKPFPTVSLVPAVLSSSGVSASIRSLSAGGINIEAKTSGWHGIDISLGDENGAAKKVRIDCGDNQMRGKFNTHSTPLNFIELINDWAEGSVQAKLKIVPLANNDYAFAEFEIDVPRGGRVDVPLHDLLRKQGVVGPQFGKLEITHNGPVNALKSFVSFYDKDLTLRGSVRLWGSKR